MEILDSAVLDSIEHQVLTPDAVTYTIEKAYELVQKQLKNDPERPRAIQEELRILKKELGNFMGLIASGAALAASDYMRLLCSRFMIDFN